MGLDRGHTYLIMGSGTGHTRNGFPLSFFFYFFDFTYLGHFSIQSVVISNYFFDFTYLGTYVSKTEFAF